ncbi:hypothetical protein CY34DRAFT_797114 [Suillus luteus UH-Slu-Lm8-n1]|uniref:Uncharacterized protein n=1 Tax=Suillus luteus UH-Slu-Lm8-n1 TaxID=930992 RepID=A0A0D0C4C1_9AGAM|nr:hypothetical protein CY34DRAFT_797114 [Suillus luteus UH-Slu-Lm8-n1]
MVVAKQALSRQPGLLSLVLPVIMCYDMMKKKHSKLPAGQRVNTSMPLLQTRWAKGT